MSERAIWNQGWRSGNTPTAKPSENPYGAGTPEYALWQSGFTYARTAHNHERLLEDGDFNETE